MAGEENVVEIRLRAITEFEDEFRNLSTSLEQLERFTDLKLLDIDAASVDEFITSLAEAQDNLPLLKATLDDVTGSTSQLSEAGIEFTDEQREQIGVLLDNNQLLDAQKLVLDEISKQYKGTSDSVRETTEAFSMLGGQLGKLRALIAPIIGGIGFGALIANVMEAEEAGARLDASYRAMGGTLGMTRQQLDMLASSIQATTTFSDEAVKEAEALVLTFDKVRGQAFERTIRAAADLAALMGRDLPSTARLLGRAIQDPVRGLESLRRLGVVFTAEQRETIRTLQETGHAFEAQALFLTEIERISKGTAATMRDTLGGALKGLQNAISDLTEGGKEDFQNLTDAINGISEALNDPELKKGIDFIIGGFATLLELALKLWAVTGSLLSSMKEFGTTKMLQFTKEWLKFLEKLPGGKALAKKLGIDEALAELEIRLVPKAGMGGPESRGARGAQARALKVAREEEAKNLQSLSDMLTAIISELKTGGEFRSDVMRDIDLGLRKQIGSRGEAESLMDERKRVFEEGLRAQQRVLDEFADNMEEKENEMTEAAIQAARDIESAFTEAFMNMGSGLNDFAKSVVDALRRMVANIASTVVMELLGVETLLKDIVSGISSGGTGKGGGLLPAIFGLLGGSAGGGRFSGLQVVGEEGPEIVGTGINQGQVWNPRQLAFAGGGNKIDFRPETTINIVARGDDANQLRTEFTMAIATNNRRQQKEMLDLLNRNGFGRLR